MSEWQIAEGRKGLPQKFRLGSRVVVRQDGLAPAEWAGDWAGVVLEIIGVHIDASRPGRVCYYVPDYPHGPMAEDWLEAAP